MSPDLGAYRNVCEVLADRTRQRPDRTALIVSQGAGADGDQEYTYTELLERARHSARWLHANLEPGSRVVLALPSSVDFVESYLGCLLAGMTAVPVPPPNGSRTTRTRIEWIVRDCDPHLALTRPDDLPTLTEALARAGNTRCAVRTPAAVRDDTAPAPRRPPPPPSRTTLGVLQYSSGSTGEPKGVMVSHGNILANAEMFCRATDTDERDIFGSWIPLHHDMGLFAMLTAALLAGAVAVLMPATAFAKQPLSWLHLIDRHRISVSAAPGFAFDLCLRAAPPDSLDLSRLRCVINGAEPVHVPTLRAFTERFAPSGLAPDTVVPGYGLAEATVYVSTKPARRPPRIITTDEGRQLAGCGLPYGFDLRIVDPATRRVRAPGEHGEIWLRGASVGQGYWNRPQDSAETFHAALAGHGQDGGWLRTGDLGSVLEGELVVTGRLQEVMEILGRAIHPQDVEHEARAAHPLLDGLVGAAFTVAAPEDRVVLVHEIGPKTPPGELPGLVAAVRERLTDLLGAPLRDVVLVRRGAVRRTTSGKVRRGAMRSLFLAGALEPVYTELDPEVLALLPDRPPDTPAPLDTPAPPNNATVRAALRNGVDA